MTRIDMLKIQLQTMQQQLDAAEEVYKENPPKEGEMAYVQLVAMVQTMILAKAIKKLRKEIVQQEQADKEAMEKRRNTPWAIPDFLSKQGE